MRLTERDQKVIAKLRAARWLSTRQVAALLFPDVKVPIVRRRLRVLRQARYISSVRAHYMAEALHTLGPRGRDLVLERGAHEVRLQREPPKNLAHFLGINDIRIAIERSAERAGIAIGYFLACWELSEPIWPFRVIPDAVCELNRAGQSITVLFEYDRGEESLGYITRTKFVRYAEGLDGYAFSHVLIVVESPARVERLREYTAAHLSAERDKFSFLDRDTLLVLERWRPVLNTWSCVLRIEAGKRFGNTTNHSLISQ